MVGPGLFSFSQVRPCAKDSFLAACHIETGTREILSLKLQRQVDAVNSRKPFTISLARCSVWPQGLQSAMLQKQQHKYNIEAMRTEKGRRSNFEAMQVAHHAAYSSYHQANYYSEDQSVQSAWGNAGSFRTNRKKQPRLACDSNTQEQ